MEQKREQSPKIPTLGSQPSSLPKKCCCFKTNFAFHCNFLPFFPSQTALHLAAEKNQHLMVSDLISLGANVNEQDRAGKTPLHLCAENGYLRVLEVNWAFVLGKNGAKCSCWCLKRPRVFQLVWFRVGISVGAMGRMVGINGEISTGRS